MSRRGNDRRPMRNVAASASAAVAPTGVTAPAGIEYLSGGQNGNVTGAGFVNGAVAYVDGVAMTTVFNSSTSLTVTFVESIFWPNDAFTHTRSLTVTNPSSAASAPGTLTVVIPAVFDEWWRGDQCTQAGTVSLAAGIFGTGHNLVQNTAGNRPTYNATGLNGKPTWSGGGTKCLISTSFAATQPFGYLTVRKLNVWANGTFFIGTSGGTGFGSVYCDSLSTLTGFAAGSFSSARVTPLGTWLREYFKFNGATGGSVVNNKYSTGNINAGSNAFATGFTLFANTGGTANGNFDCAELVNLKGIPSATQLAQFQKYTDLRYFGIADNTVDHNVVCHGDSRTFGTGSSVPYPEQLGYMLGTKYNMVNSGVSGADAPACIANFATKVTAFYDATKAKNIYVLDIGINDFGQSLRTPTQLKDDINTLFTMARAAGFNWCHLNPLCAGVFAADSGAVRTAKEAVRVDFMTNWRSLCTADSFGTIDSRMDSEAATANTTYYSDLLHLRPVGYGIQAATAVTGILAAG